MGVDGDDERGDGERGDDDHADGVRDHYGLLPVIVIKCSALAVLPKLGAILAHIVFKVKYIFYISLHF